ncbi:MULTISPECIES: hypothetical protein [unclassified Desulfovibrio]|uniref:hypothetical protein n=1 Tax=unclassified Desulfovibrio TaxID=2593640 RepID=UPI002FDA1E9C
MASTDIWDGKKPDSAMSTAMTFWSTASTGNTCAADRITAHQPSGHAPYGKALAKKIRPALSDGISEKAGR